MRFRFIKWWEYLALSPFANPEKDKERLDAFITHKRYFRGAALNVGEYCEYCLFDDLMEAVEKLRELSAAGIKIVIYGAGDKDSKFIRLARFMNVPIDAICDLLKAAKVLTA